VFGGSKRNTTIVKVSSFLNQFLPQWHTNGSAALTYWLLNAPETKSTSGTIFDSWLLTIA
jgi:hypothetical protein